MCRDLLGGIANDSEKGKICKQFYGCSTCPGAIVILDDPRIVGKLLKTVEALEEGKFNSLSQGWSLRFKAVYEPTLNILKLEILPKVSPDILKIARSLMNFLPDIPNIE